MAFSFSSFNDALGNDNPSVEWEATASLGLQRGGSIRAAAVIAEQCGLPLTWYDSSRDRTDLYELEKPRGSRGKKSRSPKKACSKALLCNTHRKQIQQSQLSQPPCALCCLFANCPTPSETNQAKYFSPGVQLTSETTRKQSASIQNSSSHS